MSLGDAIAAGLGAGASGAALIGVGLSARHAIRGRGQQRRLWLSLERLVRIDHWISLCARHLDARLEDGVGWAGWDLWPVRLTGGLNYLTGLMDELERTSASLRSIDEADRAIGRLRDDLEALCLVLRDAAARHRAGTVESYRSHQGEPIPVSAGGREPTPTLLDADVPVHREARSRAELLVRSCLYRSNEHLAERYHCQWLVQRWERERLDAPIARGPVPMPIDWFEDMPAID